jgi:hypothetical protein
VVGDDVVEFAGDPPPLLLDGSPGVELTLALETVGTVAQGLFGRTP